MEKLIIFHKALPDRSHHKTWPVSGQENRVPSAPETLWKGSTSLSVSNINAECSF